MKSAHKLARPIQQELYIISNAVQKTITMKTAGLGSTQRVCDERTPVARPLSLKTENEYEVQAQHRKMLLTNICAAFLIAFTYTYMIVNRF